MYEVKLNVGAAKPARHVVKVEVFSPDGGKSLRKALPHTLYSTNLDTRAGAGSGQFRLALNDAVGVWRLVVTDVISGEKAEASWKVR